MRIDFAGAVSATFRLFVVLRSHKGGAQVDVTQGRGHTPLGVRGEQAQWHGIQLDDAVRAAHKNTRQVGKTDIFE